jgi:cation/acetate symporter
VNLPALIAFTVFVLITLCITAWASRRTGSRNDYYVAGGEITGLQNGIALAGDYISAAVLLGVAGLYFTSGLDGFVYNVGGIVGWPILLFLFAARLRRLGRYTLTDVLSARLRDRPVRIYAASANLIVLTFYLVAQLVGAGLLMSLLLGISFMWSTILMGSLMIIYVVFGGMVATTWVQIVKAVLLVLAGAVLAMWVLVEFNFSPNALLQAAVDNHPNGMKILGPSTLISGPGAAISLGLTLVCGPAGLPHILMRFFTVPDAVQARRSAWVATLIIGVFCVFMIMIGYGAIAVLGNDPQYLEAPGKLIGGNNMAALYLAQALGGDVFLGIIAAVAFATILAVVSGLTIAAAATVSHDLYATFATKGFESEEQELRVSRIAAFSFAAVGIALSLFFQHENINILAATAFSVAASATFPTLTLALFWKRLTTAGAIAGGTSGLAAAIGGIVLGPAVWVGVFGFAEPVFPYQYPTIMSMPIAFVVAIAVTLLGAPELREDSPKAGRVAS